MRFLTTRMACLLIILAGVFPNIAFAQTGQGCSCPTNDMTTVNMTICVGGQECVVEVTYCNAIFPGGTNTVSCSNGGAVLIDMYTKIHNICPVDPGCVVMCNPQVLLAAIMCEMNPLGGDYFNVKGSIPICGSYPITKFCWVVATPRCMTRSIPDNCLVECGDACCIKRYEYCKDPGTGTYIAALAATCSTGQECIPQGSCVCIDACIDWNPMTCPTCP